MQLVFTLSVKNEWFENNSTLWTESALILIRKTQL